MKVIKIPDYCSSVGVINPNFDPIGITFVNFGNINNSSGITTGYNGYTSQSNAMELGSTDNLTVNLDTGGNFNAYCYAWIDWNRDGDFDDSGEEYDLGNATNTPNGPTSNSALSITVPIDAELGDTRMRILTQYYFNTIPTIGPCDGSNDGEVEDYTITILPGIEYTYDNAWLP